MPMNSRFLHFQIQRTASLAALVAAALGFAGCGDDRSAEHIGGMPSELDQRLYSIDTGVGGRPAGERPYNDPLRYAYYGLPLGSPLTEPPPVSLHNVGYESSFDARTRNPSWVAYRLFASDKGTGKDDRSIIADPRTTPAASGKHGNDPDRKSPFSQVLLVPPFAIAADYGDEAAKEARLSSASVPYRASRSDAWQRLTNLEPAYAKAYDEVWVLAGPIYGTLPNQPSGRAVPEALWKIQVSVQRGRTAVQAFVVAQPPEKGSEKSDLTSYLTTVADIERRTGLSFFSHFHDVDGDTRELIMTALPKGLWSTERPATTAKR
jgi:DNA/RNA endonuclease G (NUC1)